MLKAVLFDIDGVMIDSEPMYFKAVRETFLHYGVDMGKEEYIGRWMTEQTCTAGAIADYGLEVTLEEVRQRKGKIVQKLLEGVQMMPGAQDVLDYFWARHPVGAVTSAARDECLMKLNKFDLTDSFDVVVAAGDTKRKKPYPDPYIKACDDLGIHYSDVLAVEDNPSGVLSAKRAGCKVVGFPNGFSAEMDFSKADAVIAVLTELMTDNFFPYNLF